MAFTCGFFNSENGDRKYNAEQMSAIFDGIIADGVFTTIGDHMAVSAGTGMQVLVGTGKAWFDHTWNVNDAAYPLAIAASDVTLGRIDAIVLETNHSDSVRLNKLRVVQGTVASSPVKPTLTNSEKVHQHPLAWVTVAPGVTQIAASAIENAVGTSACPFVTGIIATTAIDDLFNQWNGEFDEWFDNLKAQLSDNVVANLQKQIDDRVKIADKATSDDVYNGTDDTKWVTPKGLSGAVLKVGDIQASGRNLETETNGKFLKCDGRSLQLSAYPLLANEIGTTYGAGAPSLPLDSNKNTSLELYDSSDNGVNISTYATSPSGNINAILMYASDYNYAMVYADRLGNLVKATGISYDSSYYNPPIGSGWINEADLALLHYQSDSNRKSYRLHFINYSSEMLSDPILIEANNAYYSHVRPLTGRVNDNLFFIDDGESNGLLIKVDSSKNVTRYTGVYSGLTVNGSLIQMLIGEYIYIRSGNVVKRVDPLTGISTTLSSGPFYTGLMNIPASGIGTDSHTHLTSFDRRTSVYIYGYGSYILLVKLDGSGNPTFYNITNADFSTYHQYYKQYTLTDQNDLMFSTIINSDSTVKLTKFNINTNSFDDLSTYSVSGFNNLGSFMWPHSVFGNGYPALFPVYSGTKRYTDFGYQGIFYNNSEFRIPNLTDKVHYIKALK